MSLRTVASVLQRRADGTASGLTERDVLGKTGANAAHAWSNQPV